ncbi:MAG: patatin-like phospholipase family protein [Spirochaetales bacterium]|nr:patatin-like phospholipase family protein [Spirochaetales bacterium]
MEKDAFALVLSGGGAKGAYQIGVWKALNEEGINIHAFAGTSVGALNAAIIANGNFPVAEDIWSGIRLSDIVCIPDQLLVKGNLVHNPESIRKFIRYIIKNRGLVTRPLYRLIRKNIDEKRIRNSVSDLGIVTYSLTDLKPFHLFLDQIPQGQLYGYLLASAAMPIFRAVNINGKIFTDGGVADNMPFEMIRQRGYKKIITVDMSAIGISKRPVIEGTQCIYIKNTLGLGDEIDFRQSQLQRSLELGYLDARKVFGHFFGQYYFLTRPERLDEQICTKLLAFLNRSGPIKALEGQNCPGNTPMCRLRSFLPEELQLNRYPGICFLECAARSLNVNREIPYTAANLVKAVQNEYQKIKLHREWKKLDFLLTRRIRNKRKQNGSPGSEPLDYETMALALNRDSEYVLSAAVQALFPYAQAARLFLFSYFGHTDKIT